MIKDPENFLPLTPAVFHILLALASGEKHGYAIMQEVENDSGIPKMGPGTLYGSIKRLLSLGLITESSERPDPKLDDQRRRYYKLTRLGANVLRAESKRLERLLALLKSRKIQTST